MYKALIFDIDGTVGAIGTDGTDILPTATTAVHAAQLKDKKVTCATGRGWPRTKPVVNQLGISAPCIIQGGSCIIDPKSEKVLWEMSLSKQETVAILDIFKELVTNKTTSVTVDKSRIPVAQLDHIDGSNRVIYLLGVDATTAQKVADRVNATDFAVAHKTTPSWYGPEYTDVHVTNPGGTKEHAIQQWQKMMEVTKEETIGLGDSGNDLPLFNSVGLKVAVGNAHQDLKSQADKIVAAYNQGALQQTIELLL